MEKSAGDIIILHRYNKNHDYMLYCSWDLARDRYNCYFSFWTNFCPFIPLTVQNFKVLKKWEKKNTWRYHHFTYLYQKLWSDNVRFLRYGARRTDGQTDGRQKKWHIEVGAPPKKRVQHIQKPGKHEKSWFVNFSSY